MHCYCSNQVSSLYEDCYFAPGHPCGVRLELHVMLFDESASVLDPELVGGVLLVMEAPLKRV